LPSELARLRQQRRELRQRVDELRAAYEAANSEANAQAASLRVAADAAAADMRSAFGAASAAYSARDGAAASGLAAQGRAARALAQSLNAQASAVFDSLAKERDSLKQARTELRQLDERIRQAEEATAYPAKKPQRPGYTPVVRAVQLKGFSQARGIDERMVRQILSELAPKLVGQIGGISYVDQLGYGNAIGRTSAKPNIPVKGQIYLYNTIEWDLEYRQHEYAMTVVHEAGHVLFERLTTAEQRSAWYEMYVMAIRSGGKFVTPYASESLREDFAESFMKYRLDTDDLYKYWRERYDFIDRLYKEVSK
jgi:hypothetical protein